MMSPEVEKKLKFLLEKATNFVFVLKSTKIKKRLQFFAELGQQN